MTQNIFFSIDLTDEKLDKILKFREKKAIVIPECFTSKVLEILDDEKYKYQPIKAYLTSIPILWLFLEDASLDKH